MVEEIRTYLLNSNKFSSVCYFPSEYEEKILQPPFSLFRDALLGSSAYDTPAIQAWRANVLISGIYRDPVLSSIANSLFDTRLVQGKLLIPTTLDPSLFINVVHPNMFISTSDLWSAFDGINEKKIVITKSAGSDPVTSVVATVASAGRYDSNTINFTFSGDISDLRKVPNTPISIAFTNCSSIPDSFAQTTLDLKYPNYIDIDGIVNSVDQVPGKEGLITGNSVASAALRDFYYTTTRPHQSLLCLLMGYACSLKNS